jgi:hypothetical protein
MYDNVGNRTSMMVTGISYLATDTEFGGNQTSRKIG